MTLLEVDVSKRLGSFELRARFAAEAETLVLFGPSGSGKSLTLRAVAGLLRPDGGRIVVDGEPLFDAGRGVDLPPERRRVGYVPQGYALFPHLTVAENVGYGLGRLTRAERAARVGEAIELLGLGGLEARRPAEISGGQQQRVALARALVVRPRVLLLDEPFAALDAEIRRSLRAELAQLQRRVGISVLFVTHDAAEAHVLGDRIAVYDRGLVLQSGGVEAVFAHPASRRVAELTATRNVLPGRVVARGEGGLRVRVGRAEVEAPPHPLPVGAAVELCIRPEHVLLVRPEQPAHVAPRSNLLQGTIVRELAYGSFRTLYFQADELDELLEVDVPVHPYEVMGVARQRRWALSLKRSAIHLIELPRQEADS